MKRRILPFAAALLVCLAVLPAGASADMGPKPQIVITVVNAPEEYYLDLLVDQGYREQPAGPGEGEDAALIRGLTSWTGEGWYPALAWGTRIPLYGSLAGVDGVHTFGYAPPAQFRIAVSDPSGARATEEVFHRDTFHMNLTYDYAANRVVAATPVWLAYLLQFASTCLPTLAVEAVVLLLFGFKLRENWRVFLLVNILTQIGLTATMGAMLIRGGRQFLYYPALALAELAVFAVEAGIFSLRLKGGTPRRRVACALCANAASCALGILTLGPLDQVLKGL